MISFSIIKNLSLLNKTILQSEIFNLSSCTVRSLSIKSAPFSNCIFKQKFNTPKVKNYFHSQSSSKDLGKIVDLDLDFDDVRIDDEIKPNKRKRSKKFAKGLPARGGAITEEGEALELEELDVSNYIVGDSSVDDKEEKKEEVFFKRTSGPYRKKTETKDDTEFEKKNKTGGRGYEDLGKNSVIFGSLMSKVKSRKENEDPKLIAIEGRRLIFDALAAGLTPLNIFFSRASDLEEINLPSTIKALRVPYRKLKLWSDVVTPQGVVAIFEIQEKKLLKSQTKGIPVTVICDSIKDPGNLGSILRVVAAVGCEKLILTKGCVNVWEPKVLRAGAGAHFRIPVSSFLSWKDIENEIKEESKILLADINNYKNADTSGGEKKNLSWGFSKSSEISEFLPKHCYHSFEYECNSTVIVIGGEGYGLSEEAYQFAINRNGAKIYIPMYNEVESLNTSVALGILTYEIRRQLTGSVEDSQNFETESS